MRQSARTVLVCLAATACGAATDPPGNPVDEVPVATSITAQSGDGQAGPPGSALALPPTVLVRDQDGRAMPGVVVTFTVDSGGGTVANSTVTTGATGTASSGTWTIGFGQNKLRATAGSLAPVFFRANSQGGMTIAEQVVPSSGGTVTVSRPGDPTHGLSVSIPGGAFSTPTTLRISYDPDKAVTLPAGLTRASGVVTLESTQPAYASGPIQISLPFGASADRWPIVYILNSQGVAVETMPSVPMNGGRTVALTLHLDQDNLQEAVHAAASPFAAGAAVLAGDQPEPPFNAIIQLVIGTVTMAELAKDIDTGYRPAVDDWEIERTFLGNGGSLANSVPGFAASSAWYYAYFRNAGHPQLNGRFQREPGIQFSNDIGYSIAGRVDLLSSGPAHIALDLAFGVLAIQSGQYTADSLRYLNIKAGLYKQGPQVVWFFSPVPGSATAQSSFSALIYRSRGRDLDVTLGVNPIGVNAPQTLRLQNGVFQALTWHVLNMKTRQYVDQATQGVVVIGQSAGLSYREMASTWQRAILNDLPGLWPHTNLIADNEVVTTSFARTPGTLRVRDDSTRATLEALAGDPADCQNRGGLLYAAQQPGQAMTLLGTMPSNGTKADATDDGKRGGIALFCDTNDLPAYLGWMSFAIKASTLTVSPNPLNMVANTHYDVTATLGEPLPPNPAWVWNLGDGRTMTTPTNTAVIRYPSDFDRPQRTHEIKVTLTSNAKTWATGKVTANVTTPQYTAWRITSATFTTVGDTRNNDPLFQAAFTAWRNSSGNSTNEAQMFSTYRADSLFFLGAQGGTAAAVVLLERDVPHPELHPTFGHVKGVYFWPYGSVPASALSAISTGLVGSSNSITMGRGLPGNVAATSCVAQYNGFHNQTGTIDNGTVSGQMWVLGSPLSLPTKEPSTVNSYQVSMNGDVATGHVSKTYRLGTAMCFGAAEITWTFRLALVAERIK